MSRLLLPLFVALLAPLAPPTAAQFVGRPVAFTPLSGVPSVVGVQAREGGGHGVVIVEAAGRRMLLGTTFARGTAFSGFRYHEAGAREWVSFVARDARASTRYAWHFDMCALRWTATDRRTGRVTQGEYNVCNG